MNEDTFKEQIDMIRKELEDRCIKLLHNTSHSDDPAKFLDQLEAIADMIDQDCKLLLQLHQHLEMLAAQ